MVEKQKTNNFFARGERGSDPISPLFRPSRYGRSSFTTVASTEGSESFREPFECFYFWDKNRSRSKERKRRAFITEKQQQQREGKRGKKINCSIGSFAEVAHRFRHSFNL